MNRTPVADWQQLSALYELADTLDPDSLADWLAQLRLQAHPLLPQLEQMMAAREEVQHNGFLGTLPRLSTTPEPRATTWQAGSRIGPYRLLRQLGSGGMAEVWLARRDDGAFQRQVAIKLLFRHAGSSERDTFAQRFDRERDILASLNHPHIAGLHDAGVTPSGQPWLALEYVEGQTLSTWCDARALGIEARVRLFRQVLLAVQHAHANLVIHRDLKPGNILVTAEGEVRLLDFGIAKLMEPEGGASVETELTRMAGRPMTPQYAAPEQLLGQPLTTACDVYALGVVLYELLCGERPYELKVDSAAQLEQAILDTEPRAPSRRALSEATATARGTTSPLLRKQLSSDLDAIVLRTLAKQPTQRYVSVEALGADLDRWLGGEPVEARAPSTVYRVGKFVRRHTLSVSLGVGAVVSLVAVAAVAVVMGLQAREDSARAVAARDFMLNIFARANQEKSRGADITARDLLETGRKDVLTRMAGQPRLQAELLRGIAKIQSDMGEYVTADSTYADLVRIYAEQRQPREQALAQIEHALNALSMNSPELARRRLHDAQVVATRVGTDSEINAGLAEVRGWLLLNAGNATAARAALSTERDSAIQNLGETHLRTFRLGQALFRAERESGEIDAALTLQSELRRVANRIAALGADEFASMDLEQLNLLIGVGQFDRALNFANEVLPQCVEALGAQAQPCRYLTVRQGQLLMRVGRVEQALQSIPMLRAIADDATLPYLQIEALLLELRMRSAGAGGASAAEVDAVAVQVTKFAKAGPDARVQAALQAGAALGIAEWHLRKGDAQEARNWIEAALTLLGDRTDRPAGSRTGANARALIGIALLQQGQASRALDSLRNAHVYFEESLGSDHPSTQMLALNQSLALSASGRAGEALALARRALPILRTGLGENSPAYRQVLSHVAELERHEIRDGSSETGSYRPAPAADDVSVAARRFFNV